MYYRAVLAASLVSILSICFVNCGGGESQPVADNNSAQSTCYDSLPINQEWSNAAEVPVDGYTGSAMEPRVTADEVVLFWNDKPSSGDSAMNIHYAVKQPSGRYQYVGTVPGTVDGAHLDGVPAVDSSGNFYFVSTRTYDSNSQTIFAGQVNVTGPGTLQVVSVAAADGSVSAKQPGVLDMDIDVSWDGQLLLISRATFSGKAYPDTSRLMLFDLNSRVPSARSDSEAILSRVNRSACRVYAANLSDDKLELYYTVMPAKPNPMSSEFRVLVAKRASAVEPFADGAVIGAINGEASEGPSISKDGRSLYYHQWSAAAGAFKIWRVSR